MKTFSIVSACISLVAIATPASLAQGFYVDGGYSKLSLDLEVEDSFAFDFDLAAIGGHFGYDFSPYFAVEAEGLYGLSDDSAGAFALDGELVHENDMLDDVTYYEIDLSVELKYLVGAFAKANWPVTEQFTIFGRAGYAGGEIEGTISDGTDSETVSDTGKGFAYGLGLSVDLNENVFIRGDYTIYDIEDAETDAFMIGAGIRF
jgi:outer membrane immunogenic protein